MPSEVTILGEPLFSQDQAGKLKSRIATIFPHHQVLVTLPMVHAFQIDFFVDRLKAQRSAAGLPPLSPEEERDVRSDAVPLSLEGDVIYIRPDPDDMPLAFEADRLLQAEVSKRRIKFLSVLNAKVRDAVKRRGECWRIAPLPICRSEIRQRIEASRMRLGGREIFYYNSTTGTRLLTCQEFSRLSELPEDELREHLVEIRDFCAGRTSMHYPEIAFFMADDSFNSQALAA